jgi:hypothetical protein
MGLKRRVRVRIRVFKNVKGRLEDDIRVDLLGI